MKVAIVHDWLYTIGGAERVLAAILRCYPEADVFALFDMLPSEQRDRIGLGPVRTSFLQRLPGVRSRHRLFLPLMPIAVEQFDLRGYDLVISSSYAVAKGVLTGPDQLHVSYVHSPMRYAWDLQHEYLAESKLEHGLRGALARRLLHSMRLWDVRTANGVDHFVANSAFVARRIRKAYRRTAFVIHPPVDVRPTAPTTPRGDHFLAASRLVPYKNIHHIVQAFAELPNERLTVVGEGPELGRLRGLAGPNVQFRGYVGDAEMRQLMATARAFIFAAEEDFGIVPVEAQAEGTPVIALGRGGVRETVLAGGNEPTGLFFDAPTPAAIADAVRRFLATADSFSASACHRNALRFSTARFETEFTSHVDLCWAAFRGEVGPPAEASSAALLADLAGRPHLAALAVPGATL